MLDNLTIKTALNYVAAEKARREEYRNREGWQEHCIHGTYIGTPFGADYMCGRCEDGAPENVYAEALARAKENVKRYRECVSALSDLILNKAIDHDDVHKIHAEARARFEIGGN